MGQALWILLIFWKEYFTTNEKEVLAECKYFIYFIESKL